jgi:hypothetical protein
VREVWWGCKDAIKKYKGSGQTKEPENMFGQVSFFSVSIGGSCGDRYGALIVVAGV